MDDLNRQHRGLIGALGQAMGNHTGIAWNGTSHTADLAMTLALGPGAAHFASLMHHTDAHRVLLGLWDIDHVNPTMTRDAARKFRASREKDDIDMHWARIQCHEGWRHDPERSGRSCVSREALCAPALPCAALRVVAPEFIAHPSSPIASLPARYRPSAISGKYSRYR